MLGGRGEISQVGIVASCSDHEEMLSRLCWPCEMCHIMLPHLQTSYNIVCSDFARQNFHSDAVAIYTHASLPSFRRRSRSSPFVPPPPSPRRNTRISAFNRPLAHSPPRSLAPGAEGDLNGLRALPPPPSFPCQVTRPSVTDE